MSEVGFRICPGNQRGFASATTAGFTLLELMVVLVLIAIMAAVMLPEMKGTYEDALLRSTGRKLVSAFSLASSQAVTLNQEHRVRLDTKEGRYRVERAGSEEEGSDFIPLRELAGGEGELDRRITIEIQSPRQEPADPEGQDNFSEPLDESITPLSTETVSFFADGTAEDREILLRDREGFGIALRVNPITARIQILPLDRKQ
jgi:type II secretion system protein H